MDEHVTTGQAIILIITTRIAIAISTMPTVNLPPYNQDLWFMDLVSIIYTIIMFIPLLFLANKFSNLNLIGYIRLIYGKILGGIITILYGLYFIMNSVNGLTIVSELTTSTVLVQERSTSIIIFITIVMYYLITVGLVSGVRGLQLLVPISIFITVILMLLGISNVDFSLLRPVLADSSFMEINKGAALLSLFFSEMFLLFMIVPELKNKKNINKIAIISVAFSMLYLATAVILTQGVLGIEQTRHSNASFLLYVRLIDAFDVFERIDSVFIAGWIIISIGRNSGFLYISTRTFRELFNRKEDDRIILTITSLVVLIISLSIITKRSVVGIRSEFDLIYGTLFVIFAIIIPVITCIVYFFRRKTLRAKEPSNEFIDKLE